MFKALILICLFECCLHGQIFAADSGTPSEVGFPPQPFKNVTENPFSTTINKPTTSTTWAPTTSSTSAKPPQPTSLSTTTSLPTTTPHPTSSTSAHTTTLAPNTTTTTAVPVTSTVKPSPPPSDRKFDAFSFLGGFCLALGLGAISFLAWKFYVSRQENVYHTL